MNSIKANNILLSLFSASLLISQSLMDFFALCLSLLLLYPLFKKRKLVLYKTGLEYFFPFLVISSLVGLFIENWSGEYSSDYLLIFKAFFDWKWLVLFYAIPTALSNSAFYAPISNGNSYHSESRTVKDRGSDGSLENGMIKWGSVILLLCSLYAVVVHFMRANPLKGADFQMDITGSGLVRTGGLLGQPIIFAHAYNMVFCLFFGVLFYQMKEVWSHLKGMKEQTSPAKEQNKISIVFLNIKFKNYLLILATATTFLGIFLSFTRGAWISIWGALLGMVFLVHKRIGFIFSIGSLIFILTLMQIWPEFKDRATQFLKGSEVERMWIYKANWEMFKDFPIFGIGKDQNVEQLDFYYEKLNAPPGLLIGHAHNQYLNWLASQGLVGFFLNLVFWGYFLLLSFKVFNRIPLQNLFYKGLSLGIIGSQLTLWLGGLTNANFEHSKIRYVTVFIWSLLIYLYNDLDRDKLEVKIE